MFRIRDSASLLPPLPPKSPLPCAPSTPANARGCECESKPGPRGGSLRPKPTVESTKRRRAAVGVLRSPDSRFSYAPTVGKISSERREPRNEETEVTKRRVCDIYRTRSRGTLLRGPRTTAHRSERRRPSAPRYPRRSGARTVADGYGFRRRWVDVFEGKSRRNDADYHRQAPCLVYAFNE